MDTYSFSFTIILAGDCGVGKTCFLERHRNGLFRKQYQPAFGTEEHSLVFSTNYGLVQFKILDVAGQEKYSDSIGSRFEEADGAIVMFDVTSRLTYKNLDGWNKTIDAKVGHHSIPKVICGNKTDMKDRKVKIRYITWPKRQGHQYYDISVKNLFNIHRPFLYLARELTKRDDLIFAT